MILLIFPGDLLDQGAKKFEKMTSSRHRYEDLISQRNGLGVPKWGLARGGGEISILGVVRARVAIINFASIPCENLRVYIGFNKELPHKKRKINHCNRCANDPNY